MESLLIDFCRQKFSHGFYCYQGSHFSCQEPSKAWSIYKKIAQNPRSITCFSKVTRPTSSVQLFGHLYNYSAYYVCMASYSTWQKLAWMVSLMPSPRVSWQEMSWWTSQISCDHSLKMVRNCKIGVRSTSLTTAKIFIYFDGFGVKCQGESLDQCRLGDTVVTTLRNLTWFPRLFLMWEGGVWGRDYTGWWPGNKINGVI